MAGWFPLGVANAIATGWFTLKIGGGGFATGMDMQSDGTKLARTNTGGAGKWNGTAWTQFIDNTLPSAVWANFDTMGVQEVVAAPNLTSTLYMKFNGYMLKSTSGGASGSWVNKTAWTRDHDNSNGGPGTGSQGPQIAVDPANASTVLASNNNTNGTGGLYYSLDGGTTWNQVPISQVAQSDYQNRGFGYLAIAFDTTTTSGGATPGIYAIDAGGITSGATFANSSPTITAANKFSAGQPVQLSFSTVSQGVTFTNGSAVIASVNTFVAGEKVTLSVATTSTSIAFTNGSAAIAATNTFSVGEPVTFSVVGVGAALPTNFNTSTTYYVSATGLSGSNFEVSTTVGGGGSPVIAGSAGTGTPSVNAGTLPANFNTTTPYFVIATGLSGTQFELSLTSGGSAVLAGSAGSGSPSVNAGGLPTNFSTNTTYWVIATGLSSSAFQVSATTGGSAITAGSPAAGLQSYTTIGEVYHTSTGPTGTWSRLITSSSGGPSQCLHIMVDQSGNLWASDLSVWKYNGTSWTHSIASSGPGYFSVAVDPNNPLNVFAASLTGFLNVSIDGGANWTQTKNPSTVTATDIPWLAGTAQGFMTIGQIVFDPSGSAPFTLYAAAGTGVFKTVPPTTNIGTTTVNWNSQTAGQETLVANQIIAPPGGSVLPTVLVWDRSAFRITNKNAYSNSQTAFPSNAPIAGWNADYGTGAVSTLVMIDSPFGGGADDSGISTDGGQTWNQFSTTPSFAGTWPNGTIGAGSATQFMWLRGDGLGSPAAYTSDAGVTWGPVSGLPGAFNSGRLVADKFTANTFYFYQRSGTGPGVYKCTGASCSLVHSGTLDNGNGGVSWYSVPGQAGHIFFSSTFEKVIFSNDGGATWSSALSNGVNTFATITAIGFGATFPSQFYPSVYMVGLDAGGLYGVWRCTNFNPATGVGAWTRLGYDGVNATSAYPLGTFNIIQGIAGDQTTPQLVYLATNGNGAIYGYFN